MGGLIKTNLSPGKVVRRSKTASKTHANRSSFPQARMSYSENKAVQQLEQKIITMSTSLGSNDESSGSSERLAADGNNYTISTFSFYSFVGYR